MFQDNTGGCHGYEISNCYMPIHQIHGCYLLSRYAETSLLCNSYVAESMVFEVVLYLLGVRTENALLFYRLSMKN